MEAPRISPQEAQAAMDRNEAVLVDVRTALAYTQERAAGALLFPGKGAEKNVGKLPKNKHLIFYCDAPGEAESARVAELSAALGNVRVAVVTGGLAGWKAAGLPTMGTTGED